MTKLDSLPLLVTHQKTFIGIQALLNENEIDLEFDTTTPKFESDYFQSPQTSIYTLRHDSTIRPYLTTATTTGETNIPIGNIIYTTEDGRYIIVPTNDVGIIKYQLQ